MASSVMGQDLSPGDRPVKVALWGIPRAMSTVLMKCLSAIEDMTVYMELYSYAASTRAYLDTMGKELPHGLDGNEAVYDEATKIAEEVIGSKLYPSRLSFGNIKSELEYTNSIYVLLKEQTYLFDKFQSCLPDGLNHTFLIRDPSRVYASYRKALPSLAPTLLPSVFDIDRDDVLALRPATWFETQHQLWKYVKENIDPNPVVIDASDLLAQPKTMLRAYCDSVGFPYSDDLLQWEASSDFPDNVVMAAENLREQTGLYGAALNSTHFVAPAEAGPIPREQLTDDVIRCVDKATPFYIEMYDHRLRVSGKHASRL